MSSIQDKLKEAQNQRESAPKKIEPPKRSHATPSYIPRKGRDCDEYRDSDFAPIEPIYKSHWR